MPNPTLVSLPARTAFCAAHGVAHELEFKRCARDAGRITYHMHVGLTDWPATSGRTSRRCRSSPTSATT